MSAAHDRELADVLDAEAARRRRNGDPFSAATLETEARGLRREPPAKLTAVELVEADRSDTRWLRLRGACCEHTGLREPLDEYADRIYLTVAAATGGGS